MKISQELLDELTERAKGNPRRRMHYDLRDSEEDGSMRMLNVIEPETVIFEFKNGRYDPEKTEELL
jgi:cupin fold WbuC family metalloprotein